MTNLKPFDLVAAIRGEPVITRNGIPARIICFDAKCDYFPIIALIDEDEMGCNEIPMSFSLGGEEGSGEISGCDLFMAPKTKAYWANVYENEKGFFYIIASESDEEETIKCGKANKNYLKTISFEIEV